MKKLLLLFISVLCLGLGAYAEEQLTINFNPTDLGKDTKGYVRTAFNFTKGGITFTINNVNPSSGQIQCNKEPDKTAFYIYNTTPLDNIKMIEVYFTSFTPSDKTKTPNKLYFNVGDTEISSAITSGNDGSWNSKELIATWTSEAGKSYFRINANKNVAGTVNVEKLVITYGSESTTAPEAPVVKFGETTCTANETYDIEYDAEVTVSSKNAESIIANSPVETAAEHTGNSYKFKISKSGDYTFKGKNKVGESATTTVTFNVKKPVGSGIEYVIVSSEDQLVAGESYTIASALSKKAMSTTSDNNALKAVDVKINEGRFDQTDEILNFTLGGSAAGWTFTATNYPGTNTGLNFTSSGTALKIDDTATKCAITFDHDGNAKITLVEGSTRHIQLNGTDFKHYANSYTNGEEVQLYRETVVAPTIEVDGEKISTVGSVDVKAGSLIRIIGHEANELYYIHTSTTTANRAPVANTEGWTKHDSNIYEYTVPADFATKHITITAKGVKNGKESAPVSITLHNGSTTGIEGVESAENDAEVEWFTITGVRVQQPAEGGLYIRRQGSEVSKVRF